MLIEKYQETVAPKRRIDPVSYLVVQGQQGDQLIWNIFGFGLELKVKFYGGWVFSLVSPFPKYFVQLHGDMVK